MILRLGILVATRQSVKPLPHRVVLEINNSVRCHAVDEFSDKGAANIVLLDHTETSRNKTPNQAT